MDACKFEKIVDTDPMYCETINGRSSLEVQPHLFAKQPAVVAAGVRQSYHD